MLEVGWAVATQAEVPRGDDWLGGGERDVLRRLHVDVRREAFRLGRFVGKRLLGGVELLPAEDGSPQVFRAGLPQPVTVSLSHRAGLGLCVAAAGEVALGCDVERVEPRSGAFVRDYLTRSERALVGKARAPAECANLIWSAKESALKARRTGLTRDTLELEVCLSGNLDSCAPSAATFRLCQKTPDPHPSGALRAGAHGRDEPWHELVVVDVTRRESLAGRWRRLGNFVLTTVCGGPLH